MTDSLDFKILDQLSRDARISWSDLAKEIGLSGPSTAERVKRLETKGVIKGYTAMLNPKALGNNMLAFVFVTLSHPQYRANFLEKTESLSEVQESHYLAGDDDYLLKVRCADTDHLDFFLGEKLKLIEGVAKTRTVIALSSPKEAPMPPIALPSAQGGYP